METETIDKLYLELSQISSAKTRRELELEKALRQTLTVNERGYLDNGQAIHDYVQGILYPQQEREDER